MTAPVRAGIIGCGNISDRYFQAGVRFADFHVTACADLVPERAQAMAAQYLSIQSLSVADLLVDEHIDLIINLTIPKTHAELTTRALKAGKHVYGEKPLALTVEAGERLLALAKEKGLRLGSAPDTFLGAGIQTARKLIDDNWIGRPVAATAYMQCHGHEHWHPDPAFYYQPGGGPLFDMGPYYLTALVNLLGPVKRVCAMASAAFSERTITSEHLHGSKVAVEVPTHTAGTLEFRNGALVTLIMSFDVWHHNLTHLEIHGTTGSMQVPDPNTFGGEVCVSRGRSNAWTAVPHSHHYSTEARGIGIADMAAAIRRNEAHRASGELAFHVLECMAALQLSAQKRRFIPLKSSVKRPEPLDMNLLDGFVRPVE